MRLILSLLLSLFLFCSPVFAGVLCDGVDDVVDFGTGSTFDGLTELSVYVRFKLDTLGAGEAILNEFGNTSGERSFILQTDNSASDELRFVVSNGTGNLYIRDSTDANMTTGVEYRVLATWSSAGGINIYLNGVDLTLDAILSGSVASLPSTASSYLLCREVDSGAVGIEGQVMEVATWSKKLTQADADILENGVFRTFLQVQPASLLHCPMLDSVSDGVSADGFTFNDYCPSQVSGTGIDSTNNSGMTGVAEPTHSYA